MFQEKSADEPGKAHQSGDGGAISFQKTTPLTALRRTGVLALSAGLIVAQFAMILVDAVQNLRGVIQIEGSKSIEIEL